MKTDDRTDRVSGPQKPSHTPGPDGKEGPRETIFSASAWADKAGRALKDTVQKYLDVAGIKLDLNEIQEVIRKRPLLSLDIAAAAGFVVGGGLATRLGLMLLASVGRKAATETATNFGRQIVQEALSDSEGGVSQLPAIP
jgi:hypothetical protein